ncbi:MAG: DegT/DnrJ/EryC1/StrS family aminotransferase [Victivallaceae bacterium]|nr:DegT/DnrJ/EryC1/StrS family aminotransferase [Victivallaceae bacterium]
MAKLAISGGEKLYPDVKALNVPDWPPRTDKMRKRLLEVFESGAWSFNSPAEQQFEAEFAEFQNARYGIFMANGTVTLECALLAFGVGPGDEVIVPAFTWMATALAASYVGATPVFVDIEPDTFCMDPAKMEAAITPKTKAVIPVHAYSSMADMDKIMAIARKHNLKVIEDSAHAHGTKWNGRGAGSIGDVGSFSFQQSKTMCSGEGGICTTNDPEIAEKLFLLKHIGYVRGNKQGGGSQKPPQGLLCHNYRCTAFQAALLAEELKDFPERAARCAENAEYIRRYVDSMPGLKMQARGRLADPQSFYILSIHFDPEVFEGIRRDAMIAACGAEGAMIGGGGHLPVYSQQLFNLRADQYRFGDPAGCPVTEKIAWHTIGMSHPALVSRESAEATIRTLEKVCANIDEVRQYQAKLDAAK